MIKLNIFLLYNFFLIINSESCQNNIWEECKCFTIQLNPKSLYKQLELRLVNCEKGLKKIPEIENIMGIYIDTDSIKKISFLPDNLVSNETCFYKNIIRLVFRNTNLSSINNSDFKCLSKLQQLDISQNQITKINAHAFKTLAQLQQLLLRNNKITNVDQNSFCGLSKLLLLDLQHNLITSLPAKICFPQQVKQLYLSYNHIQSKIL
jgi:Leucine-rich repeat (LRR) protein